jgi:hypothetical protein
LNRSSYFKLLLPLIFLLSGCDTERKKKCEWTLEPDTNRKVDEVNPGYVPACARNRTALKQDCRLEVTLELAKQLEGKKFRYVDMKVKNYGIPRTIEDIRTCN